MALAEHDDPPKYPPPVITLPIPRSAGRHHQPGPLSAIGPDSPAAAATATVGLDGLIIELHDNILGKDGAVMVTEIV